MKKTKHYLNPLAAAIALMSGTFVAPQIAFAQDEAREVEEVLVVSARRRDETLQEVPIALSSFTGEQMAKTGITDLVSIGASSPNTTLKTSRATNSTLTAFIRGIGQQDPLVGYEAGVGLYIDDVYLNRPQGAVLDVYDVERVEILRGPQGTLYGRNTIGGAIKYVTKRLSDEPSLNVKASLGSYDQKDLIIGGSVPLAGDTIRIGGSVASFHRDGYGENILTGQDNYDKDIVAARASLEATPSEALFIRIALDAVRDTSNPRHGHREIVLTNPDGTPKTGPVLNNVFDNEAAADDLARQNHPINKNVLDGYGFAATVEYEINDELIFKSVTAYREDESESIIDFDSIPGQGFDGSVLYENDQLSQEFQLSFNYERLQGLAGIYYLDAYSKNVFDVILSNSVSYTFGEVETSSISAFFDLSFDITDTLAVSGGLRYTKDDKDFHSFRSGYSIGPSGILASPQFGGDGIGTFENEDGELTPLIVDGRQVAPDFSNDRSDDAFTPKIGISWRPVDEHHLYASYSQGFKGGGFDPRGNYTSPIARAGFKPETVDAYELGLKSTFLDGAISTNIAGFYSDYTDVQIPGSAITRDANGVANGFDGSLSNAGEATMQGVEFDMIANLTESFSSTLALGFIDAEFDKFILQGVNQADNREIQNTPETTGAFALNYVWDLGAGELNLNGSANYTSFTYQREVANNTLDQPGYTLFNVSVTWTSDDDHWQAGLHGRNLSDKEYKVASYPFGNSGTTSFYGDPRTITGTIKYNLF